MKINAKNPATKMGKTNLSSKNIRMRKFIMKFFLSAFILAVSVNYSSPVFACGFNGSGLYTRCYNWVNDKNNGIPITASRFDTEDNGFATGLSTTITKDGQQTTTARIPFASGLSISQGNILTPSLSIIGDLSTGFYQTTSGELRFSSGGVYKATLNTNGIDNTAIGIGTAAAGRFTTATATTFSGSGASLTNIGTSNMTGVTGTANSTTYLRGDNTWSSSGTQWVTSGANINYTAGNVSIGTTAVGGTLNVSGTGTFSGSITPSQTDGIVGTTTNNDASAGSVGQLISQTVASGSAVSLTTGVVSNITSIPLTAGDYDVWAIGIFSGVANSTIVNGYSCNVSASSAVSETTIGQFANGYGPAASPFNQVTLTSQPGPARIKLGSSATYYLNCFANFSVNTLGAYGGIYARRRR